MAPAAMKKFPSCNQFLLANGLRDCQPLQVGMFFGVGECKNFGVQSKL